MVEFGEGPNTIIYLENMTINQFAAWEGLPREEGRVPGCERGRIMDDQDKVLLKGRLSGRQRLRLNGLLDMLYTPDELAIEIGFNQEQVYRAYVPLGCPHEREGRNHILINGKKFSAWYKSNYGKTEVGQDEIFCMTCKRPVKLVSPEVKQNGKLTYLLSTCPICGRRTSKIIENSRGKRD